MIIRLKDVAQRANVSLQVASAVLNRTTTTSAASPETRDRILRVARQLNYVPNASATRLARGKSNAIGIICYWLAYSPQNRAIALAERLCAQHRHALQLSRTENAPDWVSMLQSKQVDILLTMGLGDLDLAGVKVPAALRNRIIAIGALPDYSGTKPITRQWGVQYTWNSAEVGRMAADYLLAQNRKHIAILGGLGGAQDKAPSFLQRLAQHGLTGRVIRASTDDDRAYAGYEMMSQVIRHHPETDGLFLFNDEAYPGVAAAMIDHRWKSPSECAMVSYGGAYSCIPSIRPPLNQCVRLVLESYFAGGLKQLTDTHLSPALVLPTRPDDPPATPA